ncbi:unnamed protein product [Coccothraustes coccothraustes]
MRRPLGPDGLEAVRNNLSQTTAVFTELRAPSWALCIRGHPPEENRGCAGEEVIWSSSSGSCHRRNDPGESDESLLPKPPAWAGALSFFLLLLLSGERTGRECGS